MPYHSVKIDQLSEAQIGKLLRGQPVRVKYHAQGPHSVKLSSEQHKKLGKAHAKGSALTITLDPYQMEDHQHLRGHGLKSAMKKGLKKAVKAVKHHAKHVLAPKAKAMLKEQSQIYTPKAEAFLREKTAQVRAKAHKKVDEEIQKGQDWAEGKIHSGSEWLDNKLGLQEAAPEQEEIQGEGWGQFKKGLKKTFSKKNMKMVGKVLKPIASAVARPLLSTVLAPVGMSSMAGPIAGVAGLGVRRRGRPRKGGALYVAGHGLDGGVVLPSW